MKVSLSDASNRSNNDVEQAGAIVPRAVVARGKQRRDENAADDIADAFANLNILVGSNDANLEKDDHKQTTKHDEPATAKTKQASKLETENRALKKENEMLTTKLGEAEQRLQKKETETNKTIATLEQRLQQEMDLKNQLSRQMKLFTTVLKEAKERHNDDMEQLVMALLEDNSRLYDENDAHGDEIHRLSGLLLEAAAEQGNNNNETQDTPTVSP